MWLELDQYNGSEMKVKKKLYERGFDEGRKLCVENGDYFVNGQLNGIKEMVKKKSMIFFLSKNF